VVESLFKDDGYLENGELLEQLVSQRIAATCAELEAEGWSFALPVSEVKGQAHWSWQKLRPGEVKHTAEETTRLKELDAEEDGLEALDVLDDEQRARADAIYDERERIETAATARAYTKVQKAKSGCIVDGDSIMYGLVRPKAGKAAVATKPGQDGHQEEDGADKLPDGDSGAEHDENGAPRISNSLMMSISEKQTLAAAKTLAASPAVALAIVVAGLNSYDTGPVKITKAGWHGVRGIVDHGPFAEALAALDGKDLAVELARTLSCTLDLRRYAANDQAFGHRCDTPGIAALVAALPGSFYLAHMREEFDAGDYFHRSPAASIRAAIAEMACGTRELGDKVKKADLVAIATELAGPTGWLPAELRHPDYRLTIGAEPAAAPAPAKRRTKKAKAA
jgi:ParB family chromosome partitioning protein